MPSITLYVKEFDTGLIEKARKRLGDSLSSVFVDCVRAQLESAKTPRKGEPKKITLECINPRMRKSFVGTWLIGDEHQGIHAEPADSGVEWGRNLQYSVALTKQGRILVYEWDGESEGGEIDVFDDFEQMHDAINADDPRFPQNLIAETAEALGKTYEVELDI